GDHHARSWRDAGLSAAENHRRRPGAADPHAQPTRARRSCGRRRNRGRRRGRSPWRWRWRQPGEARGRRWAGAGCRGPRGPAVIEPQRLRRLLARASLVGGLTLGAVHLLPAVPREQTLEFRLPAEVARLDASWRRAGETEVVGGVTLRPEGPPRRRLRHQVALPNGLYELTVSLEPA